MAQDGDETVWQTYKLQLLYPKYCYSIYHRHTRTHNNGVKNTRCNLIYSIVPWIERRAVCLRLDSSHAALPPPSRNLDDRLQNCQWRLDDPTGTRMLPR